MKPNDLGHVGQPGTLIALPHGEVETAAGILVRAFDRDPLWASLVPDAAQRVRASRCLWAAVVGYSSRFGIVTTTTTRAGVACFLPPGRAHVTAWRELRSGLGFTRALLRLPGASRHRTMTAFRRLDDLHRATMAEPHGLLWALAVEPSQQRRGVGRALLADVVCRCDAFRVPCYLETESEANLAYYEPFGFRVVREEGLGAGDLSVWVLIRPAG